MAGTFLTTLAKRVLVTLLIAFARQYQITALAVNRDSPDEVGLKAFSEVACKTHQTKESQRVRPRS